MLDFEGNAKQDQALKDIKRVWALRKVLNKLGFKRYQMSLGFGGANKNIGI